MTSFDLKLIAILLMLIDHTGAVLSAVPHLNAQYGGIFFLMRSVGRASFPIFAFLAAEGCAHTRNIFKYLKRIALFALISEIPFNLFINFIYGVDMSIWNIEKQSVFFTWALAVFAVMIYKKARLAESILDKVLLWAAIGFTVVSAELANTDYGAFGVLLVFMLSIFRPVGTWPQNPLRRWQDFRASSLLDFFNLFGKGDLKDKNSKLPPHLKQLIVMAGYLIFRYSGSAVFLAGALCSVVAVWFYSGRKGKNLKWLFYVFYPSHILILTVIGTWL